MNTVKLRSAALAAAVSIAATAALPAASQALSRSPAPKATATLSISKECSDLQSAHGRYTSSATEARNAGVPEIAQAFDEGAANVKATAKAKDCAWAA